LWRTGEYGLKAIDRCRMTAAKYEAARRAIFAIREARGRIWLRVFQDVPITRAARKCAVGYGKAK